MGEMTVLGLGQVSACGTGIAALERGLAGLEVPEPEWEATSKGPAPTTAPFLRARIEGVGDLAPARALRRLDRFARSFVYAARLAVIDSGSDLADPLRVGVVMGTGYGSMVTSFALLDELIDDGDGGGSPFKFTTSVNNAPATCVSAILGSRGPCFAVVGFSSVLANVLRTAECWLSEGIADVVVAGAGDEVHPMLGYGLGFSDGWAADGRIRELDFDLDSFVPGESYGVMLLGRAGPGRARITGVESFRNLVEQWSPGANRPLFLAADGRLSTANTYRALSARSDQVLAYSRLWGGSPTSDALNLVAACSTLSQGAARSEASIDCVTANPDGSGYVIRVEKTQGQR